MTMQAHERSPGEPPATGQVTIPRQPTGWPAEPPVLSFHDVDMVFRGGVHAVDQVSLDVAPGELVSIVGPSGCGKSTLLRIASGLQAPTHGSVTAPDDHIAYVFQDPTLLPWRNVLDNVALCSQLRREPKSERLRKAQAAIDMVGLTGFEKRYPNQLSGGMRMRTSLARALTLDPRLFLFDEPFGAIDEITRERLNGELLRIFSGSRFAGLFVTHSIAEAVFLSSRVVVMSARPGRIIGEFAVPFPYPRTPRLRAEAEFAALTGQIGECLRGGAE